MPTKLDMHIFTNVLLPFMGILLAFSGLYMVIDMFEIVDHLLELSFWDAMYLSWQYYMNTLPAEISKVLPFLALVGVVVGISVMAKNREFMIIKASGIDLHRALLPVALFGILLGVVDAALRKWIFPAAISTAEQLRPVLKAKKNLDNARVHDIRSLELVRDGFHVYDLDDLHPWLGVAEHFSFSEMDQDGELLMTIKADKAIWRDKAWILRNPIVTKRNPYSKRMQAPRYLDVYILEDGLSPSKLMRATKDFRSMTGKELRRFPDFVRPVQTELAERRWMPYASFLLILIGIPFLLRKGLEGNYFVGGGVSMAICLGYFILLFTFRFFGNHGLLPSDVAVALPHVLLAVAGVTSCTGLPR